MNAPGTVAERGDVQHMLNEGRSRDAVEERIDVMALDEEAKAALWLLAWAEPRPVQRGVVPGDAYGRS
jgi:hypothetical protein